MNVDMLMIYNRGDSFMATSALGMKHICAQCGARYYDLNKSPATCPKCGYQEVKQKADLALVSITDTTQNTSVMVDNETALDLSDFNDDADIDNDTLPKNMDTIESFEDDDNEIESLSELEGREIHEQQVGHDDTPDEEEMIESMKDGGLIIDEIDDEK